MKIFKGDTVRVTRGKDRGRIGTVERVFKKSGRVAVSGVSFYKKHLKAKGRAKGGIVDIQKPIRAAGARLVCRHCQKETRVGLRDDNGAKRRFCRKCQEYL